MSDLERAIAIAVDAHQDQVDKAGLPYILHPLRVMLAVESQCDKIVAVLHDVVEDTQWTLAALEAEGFSGEIVEAIDRVTRRNDETYEAFIDRVSGNAIAIQVKLADLEDNMDITRINALQGKDLERLARYHAAYQKLSQGS